MRISDTLKRYIESQEFKDFLTDNNFFAIYQTLGDKSRYKTDTSTLTKLFLQFDIHPLEFMDKVPDFYAFQSELDAEYLKIPDNVQFIGFDSFCSCKNLLTVHLPKSIHTLQDGAFWVDELIQTRHFYMPNGIKLLQSDSLTSDGSSIVIHFDGTEDQWGDVDKENGWHRNTQVKVICKDGDVNIYV